VLSDVWSVTSFSELRRDGIDSERFNMLHPGESSRASYVEQQLAGRRGPVIASTDYIRAVPDQIRQWVDRAGLSYRVLGTDGYGRSDYRKALRRFFEVDRYYVTVAALSELAAAGKVEASVVADAIAKYDIDVDAPMPTTV
jgi:pyruvate dehydrogenase E1 component